MLPRFHLIATNHSWRGPGRRVVSAAFSVARAPAITTYWNTAALIDDLVREYGISTLGNVGNCAEWNVCKTGLTNELRDQPASCFVLHDLTKLRPDDARRHLAQFDAVVVLGPAARGRGRAPAGARIESLLRRDRQVAGGRPNVLSRQRRHGRMDFPSSRCIFTGVLLARRRSHVEAIRPETTMMKRNRREPNCVRSRRIPWNGHGCPDLVGGVRPTIAR